MLHENRTQDVNLDDHASFYLARIRQIDRIVQGPVKTLIQLATQGRIPTWFSPDLNPTQEENRLTESVCCGTLQNVWRFRRRFSWLDKEAEKQLREVKVKLPDKFTPKRHGFEQCARLLDSSTFGGLNPLTASQIFRILLNAGENYAHSGIGFLAFFAMIWPLCRRFPNQLTVGARIEPWEITAYVTAKCLVPIRDLQRIIERRANLYDDIINNLGKLGELKSKADRNNPRNRWLFSVELDELSANLSHLSLLSIDKNAFQNCATAIQKLPAKEDPRDSYNRVLQHLESALKRIRDTSRRVLDDANEIVEKIKDKIAKPLRANRKRPRDDSVTREPLLLRLATEHIGNSRYWEDLADAADESIGYCETALKELSAACKICPDKKGPHKPSSLRREIEKALKNLAVANREVKDVLNKPVHHAALWCRNVVDREIAHASAQNFTDFDPSELVSGIAVAVEWNLMSTQLQVSDAVRKAVAGARKDGSWRSGKPFYSPDHAFGIWATTSDIVGTLTNAIKQFPAIREADDELFNFVNWLERTQITLQTTSDLKKRKSKSAASKQLSSEYVGWASEGLRDRRTIHFGASALSISALLAVRDLAEYRLWELCKKRFSVVSIDKSLREIDPVDLGAKHRNRLHRRLEQMALSAKNNDPSAEYSLVLHGPPGSSKTKLAEALAAEMWKFASRWGPNEPRLIRITPADFTRMGEDRLDSEARAIFDLITGVRAVTIFFDEIDDLLRQRNTGTRPRFMDLVVPAMLNRLADLRSACPRQELCFVLATNYVENIDSALIRKGRIDESIPVVYPDFVSRIAIATDKLNDKLKPPAFPASEAIDCYRQVATRTKSWPYLAIVSLCRFLSTSRLANKSGRKSFEKALDEGISRFGSSFSTPAYNDRWKCVGRYSQELLNEHIHHIISAPENPRDCGEAFKDVEIRTKIIELSKGNAQLSDDGLDTLLHTISRKEGRTRTTGRSES